MLFSKEWVHWNEHLPTADDVIIVYKLLYDDNDITNEQENILNWFITTVIPVVHVASHTKFNWHPFAFCSGVPPLYSTFVTTSDEAFALFLLKHYRNPLPPKEEKSKKSVTPVKVEKKKKKCSSEEKEETEESQKDSNKDGNKQENEDDDDNEEEEEKEQDKEQNENQKQKRSYKKKIDIKQGEKDYKKWMGQLKMIKSNGRKEALMKMDKKLCSMIVEYKKKLQNDVVNVSSEVADADIIDVPDSDEDENKNNYVDLDTLGGGIFAA